MSVHRLQQIQTLAVSIGEAWRFFVDPANLPLITPPDLGFRITSELPEQMYPGLIISYTVTPFAGIPVRWLTEITHVNEPFFFVDEQRQGPYRFWHHQHLFRQVPDGVEMTDIVHYSLPFGMLGELALPLVRKRLASIFEYRRQILQERFGGGK